MRFAHADAALGIVRDEGRTHTGMAAIEAWGSPVTLRYIFTLERGKLASLEINP